MMRVHVLLLQWPADQLFTLTFSPFLIFQFVVNFFFVYFFAKIYEFDGGFDQNMKEKLIHLLSTMEIFFHSLWNNQSFNKSECCHFSKSINGYCLSGAVIIYDDSSKLLLRSSRIY